ncbi:putative ribonuclease H-like domain-containing protein [Tanacetum coccineum]
MIFHLFSCEISTEEHGNESRGQSLCVINNGSADRSKCKPLSHSIKCLSNTPKGRPGFAIGSCGQQPKAAQSGGASYCRLSFDQDQETWNIESYVMLYTLVNSNIVDENIENPINNENPKNDDVDVNEINDDVNEINDADANESDDVCWELNTSSIMKFSCKWRFLELVLWRKSSSSQVSSTPCADEVMCSFFAQQTTSPQLKNEDLQQINEDDLEELDLRWQVAMLTVRSIIKYYNCHRTGHFARECKSGRNQGKKSYGDNGRRNAPTNESSSQALVAQDGLGGYDWSNDFDVGPVNYALMAISSSSSSSSSDNEGYELALESLESRIIGHEKNELAWGEKYEFQNYELKCRKVKIINLKMELEKVVKERDELKVKIEKWEESSKSLNKNYSKSDQSDEEFTPANDRPASRLKDLKQDVKIYGVKNMTTAGTRAVVSTNKGKVDNALNKSRWIWRPKGNYIDHESKEKGTFILKKFEAILEKHSTRSCSGDSGHLVRGLPSKVFVNDHTCVACKKGKQHKASCKAKLERIIRKPLELLHMDLFGPVSVESINKKRYCLVVTDDFSRFSWVFFLATKDETSEILCNFIIGLENQLSHNVKIIRCDNGTEFKNHAMNEFCAKKGIKREFSVARTPQQNGVAERKNRTLIEAARTMLADSLLPIPFWAEAVNTACYVLNRVLVTKPQNKTPYELLIGKSPSISFMRPFGCPLTILNTLDSLGKFDGKSDEGYLLGYSTSSKAFRVYNKRTKRVEENLHINFLEDQPNVAGTGPNWMFDLDFLTNSMNYIPISVENQVIVDAGTQDSYVAGSLGNDKGPTQEYILLPLQPHRTRILAKDVVQDAQEQPSENASPNKDEQVWQDELEMMVTQELVANDMNDESRQAFEEEKRRIASQKKAAQATSTNQLSTDRPFVSTDRLFVSASSTSTGANANESSFVYLGGKIPIDASTLPNADLPIDPNMLDLEDASDTLPND